MAGCQPVQAARPFVIAVTTIQHSGRRPGYGTYAGLPPAAVCDGRPVPPNSSIFYFAFSDRVKYTLVNDLSTYRPGGPGAKASWLGVGLGRFIRNLIMYFIVFSILGHWMEMGMCQFIIMGLVQGEYDPTNTMLWRDWLYPFPMEGAAVVIIALVLYPFFTWLKKKFTGKKSSRTSSASSPARCCAPSSSSAWA